MGKTNNKTINTAGDTTSSKSDSSTETTSQKRGRGRPRKDGSAGAAAEANLPRLVLVDDPADQEIHPEEEKENLAAPKNPTKRKRKDIQYEIKKEQLAVLIKTTFDIIGSRENMEIWKMSQKEAELIAEPLSAIMAKNPIIDKLTAEYGDWIALIVALGTVILPRAFVMWAAKPKKKETIKPYVATNKNDGKQSEHLKQGTETRRNESGAAGNRDQQSDRQLAITRSYIGTELHGIIPAIQ